MTLSYTEMLVKVRRAREAIEAWPIDGRRSTLTVEMVRSLWPGASLYACLLGGEGDALDAAGQSRPDWVRLLRQSSKGEPAEFASASVALNLGVHALAPGKIRFSDARYGRLLLAIAEDALPAAQMFLDCCGQSIAVRLKIETLAEEAAGEDRLADMAEASIPIAHEFNNFLNGLLLHTAVLKIQLPEEAQDGLVEIRRQALAAAALIQQFQHYRRRHESPHLSVDLNRAVRGALAALGAEIPDNSPSTPANGETPSPRRLTLPYGKANGSAPAPVHVRLDMTTEAPRLMGVFNDLKRLCIFLLRSAAGAAAGQGGQIAVQTTCAAGKVVLKVEDAGPPVSQEQLAHLFEPSAAGRDGTSSLELAACKTITRRFAGTIRAEASREGGVTFVVEWDAAEL
jgi:signal transduction histidine kinase